ncbi:MAG: amidase domain-containing protein [Eubacteriaceae bacterium]|nr:amidase domain-containing protein [Eubacteriaceae bacterium]
MTGNANSSYNRDAAKAYAAKWWDSRNPDYPNFGSTSSDCTNFVSQCLKAGGLQEIGSDWEAQGSWFCNTTSVNKPED